MALCYGSSRHKELFLLPFCFHSQQNSGVSERWQMESSLLNAITEAINDYLEWDKSFLEHHSLKDEKFWHALLGAALADNDGTQFEFPPECENDEEASDDSDNKSMNGEAKRVIVLEQQQWSRAH